MDDIVIPHALYSVHIHATIIPQAQIVRKETAGAHDGTLSATATAKRRMTFPPRYQIHTYVCGAGHVVREGKQARQEGSILPRSAVKFCRHVGSRVFVGGMCLNQRYLINS